MQKIKAALTRSATIAWMVFGGAATVAAQIMLMPETATLLDLWKPGLSTIVFAVGGILARLRSLKLGD